MLRNGDRTFVRSLSLKMSSEANREDDEHEDPSRAMETLTTTTTTTLAEAAAANCRKEKRKLLKKLKRKQTRKDMALKERKEEEEEDPEEQRRMELKEKEEAEMMERQRKEFEERERLWLERAAKKKKEEEEEAARLKQLEEEEELRKQIENDNELNNEDDDWEYVEEGPAEIIWQGNEIIVKKKRVRVTKSNSDKPLAIEDANRPTSNPLPPQSEAFTSYKNESVSAQQVFESVSNQTPNFGTEQDKANCPFHIKTGACRFGSRCSRVHFYPDKSCTLLIKNMYNGPGLVWEQDEGLEGRLLLPNVFAVLCLNIRDLAQGLMEIQSYGLVCGWEVYHTDEEVERCYEDFYEDVHTEFLKFGEIVNFKVCRNGSFHLRGNVYVHYKSLESAMLAYHSINGRYFAGKQITCEYVGVTRWKVAICGEYMKSMFKTCSRGTACNFIHCFCNPGGDYEWADWDKPPPKYWVKKMDALFGPSDDVGYDRHRVSESRGRQRDSNKKITPKSDRYHSRRSRSRDVDYISSYSDEDNSDGNRSQRSRRSSRHKHLSSSRRTRSPRDDHDYYSVGDRERHTRYSSSHSRHRSKWKDHYDHENVENNYKGNDYEVDEGKDRSKGGDYYRQHQNHSSRREHYSRREKEADLDEHMKSDKNNESNSRGWYDGKRHFSDLNSRPTSSETVGPSDRWESRTSFPDESKRSKSYCSDDHEPVNVEYKSHDHSSGGQNKIRSTSDSRSSYRVYSEKQGEEKNASCEDLHSEDNHEYYNHSKRRHSKCRSRHDKEHRIQNNETSTSRESRGKSDLEEEEACMPNFNNDTDYYSDKHQSNGRSLNDHNDSKKGKRRSKKKQENTSKDDRASRKRSRSRSPGRHSSQSKRKRSLDRTT